MIVSTITLSYCSKDYLTQLSSKQYSMIARGLIWTRCTATKPAGSTLRPGRARTSFVTRIIAHGERMVNVIRLVLDDSDLEGCSGRLPGSGAAMRKSVNLAASGRGAGSLAEFACLYTSDTLGGRLAARFITSLRG